MFAKEFFGQSKPHDQKCSGLEKGKLAKDWELTLNRVVILLYKLQQKGKLVRADMQIKLTFVKVNEEYIFFKILWTAVNLTAWIYVYINLPPPF
jgi:hypothetical protein